MRNQSGRFKSVFLPGAVAVALTLASLSGVTTSHAQRAAQQGPAILTFDELVELYEKDQPSERLQQKLNRLLQTPFVSNAATARGVKPLKPVAAPAGKSLRVALWNIERGLEFETIKSAFTDRKLLRQRLKQAKKPPGQTQLAAILREAERLSRADVVVLNEVDWGLKRTGYRNVARELAEAMGMNYAYGVEFIEVDPLTLGTETLEGDDVEDKAEIVKNLAVDKARTHGLHGTAILSRYPLHNVRIVRFEHQGHDWYKGEKESVSSLEKGKRKAGEAAFLAKVLREVRRGGRMMLLAEIEDPEFPGGKATIVATHTEAKTKPESRVKQLEELLARIKGINHPVIVAGDMNTSGSDATPTSVPREIKKRMGSSTFWVKQGIKYGTGVGLIYSATLGLAKAARTSNDPTVTSVKVFSENPEAKFFTTLEKFRFDDGGAFDFRGDKARSAGARDGKLANSNHRANKGFVTTFELERSYKVAKFKLDWFFIKPASLTDPFDRKQPYLFAPHFGRSLAEMNYSLDEPISDHVPMIVDLPLAARPRQINKQPNR